MRQFSKDYKKVSCIYKITSPSGKVYIGQTWDLGHRYKSGISARQVLLFRSYEKYGEDAHKCELLMTFDNTATQQDLDEWEIYFMKQHQLQGVELLNIRDGGSNGKMGESTKQKLSIRSKQWHLDNPELSKKITASAILANTGAKRTEETKALQSASSKGKPKSQQHAENVSKAKAGKPSGRKGMKFSEQAVENIREGIKNKRVMSTLTPVKQFTTEGEFVNEFPSIAEAARQTDIYKGNINACVAGRKHALTAGGYIWKYSDDTTPINPADYKQEFKPKQTKVAQMKDGKIIRVFDSVKEAAKETGTDRPGIFSCLSGKQQKAGGFYWQKII